MLAGSIGRDFSWVELTLSAVVAQAASQSGVVAGSLSVDIPQTRF